MEGPGDRLILFPTPDCITHTALAAEAVAVLGADLSLSLNLPFSSLDLLLVGLIFLRMHLLLLFFYLNLYLSMAYDDCEATGTIDK